MIPDFSLERKGYNRNEVDRFFIQTEHEKELLRSQLTQYELLLKQKDEELAKAKSDLQYIGDTMIQAELAARDIVEEAEQRAQERESRQRTEVQTQLRLLEDKKQELEQMRKRMEYLLRAQLTLLEKE